MYETSEGHPRKDRGRVFEFGSKYGFFHAAKTTINLGAQFHKTIVQNEKLRNVLLERIGKLLYYTI